MDFSEGEKKKAAKEAEKKKKAEEAKQKAEAAAAAGDTSGLKKTVMKETGTIHKRVAELKLLRKEVVESDLRKADQDIGTAGVITLTMASDPSSSCSLQS